MDPHIVSSKIVTPDGTVLHSKHRHDYVTHEDANGKHYMIDGGTDYIRCSANGDEKFITVTTDDPFEVQRENFVWGTRGKDGRHPLEWRALKDLDEDHIEAILDTQTQIPAWMRIIFQNELVYRNGK